MTDHARRTSVAASPQLAKFSTMDMDQRWVTRKPRAMLDSFHWFHGEAFELIVEDLLHDPRDPVVAEGFRLLPDRVAPLTTRARCLWLLPTPSMRRAAFAERTGIQAIMARTSDSQRTLAHQGGGRLRTGARGGRDQPSVAGGRCEERQP